MKVVYHLVEDNFELYFDNSLDDRHCVAYAYCASTSEELLEELLNTSEKDKEDFYNTLPFTFGSISIACGDWVIRKNQLTQ